MLYYSLWSDGGGFANYGEGLQALGSEAATRSEIAEVVDIAYSATRHVPIELEGRLADIPLTIHARYQREEILAALDFPRTPSTFREGVWYSAERNVDVFFITLTKSEADYSPTTMYADYPISPTLFHWESQSTTSVASKTGQRYLSGSSTVLLFVRQRQSRRIRDRALPLPWPGNLRDAQGRPPDRDYLEAPTPDAGRLLQHSCSRRPLNICRSRPVS